MRGSKKSAIFVNWRNETLDWVLADVLELQRFAVKCFRREMFAENLRAAHDTNEVCQIARNPFFWIFLRRLSQAEEGRSSIAAVVW